MGSRRAHEDMGQSQSSWLFVWKARVEREEEKPHVNKQLVK